MHTNHTIELRYIRRTYSSGAASVEALRGVDFTLDTGDFVSIMGASGSGKSTLMNILGCLDRPTSGEYLLNGENVSTLSKDELSSIRNKTIGFVFQNFHLLPRTTALENVELPLLYSEKKLSWKEIEQQAKEALQIVGLGDRLDHTPSQLSGGQQQRVAIARALVTKPSLLLADEPTGNLDSKTSLEIMELFQKLNQNGLTILMVTHEPDIAAFTQRMVLLRDGLIRIDKPLSPRSASTALEQWTEDGDFELHGEVQS